MLSEMRRLVAPQDLDMYDRLVLQHGRESHQSWCGGLEVWQSQGHCSHIAPADAEQTIPAMVGPLFIYFKYIVWCSAFNL